MRGLLLTDDRGAGNDVSDHDEGVSKLWQGRRRCSLLMTASCPPVVDSAACLSPLTQYRGVQTNGAGPFRTEEPRPAQSPAAAPGGGGATGASGGRQTGTNRPARIAAQSGPGTAAGTPAVGRHGCWGWGRHRRSMARAGKAPSAPRCCFGTAAAGALHGQGPSNPKRSAATCRMHAAQRQGQSLSTRYLLPGSILATWQGAQAGQRQAWAWARGMAWLRAARAAERLAKCRCHGQQRLLLGATGWSPAAQQGLGGAASTQPCHTHGTHARPRMPVPPCCPAPQQQCRTTKPRHAPVRPCPTCLTSCTKALVPSLPASRALYMAVRSASCGGRGGQEKGRAVSHEGWEAAARGHASALQAPCHAMPQTRRRQSAPAWCPNSPTAQPPHSRAHQNAALGAKQLPQLVGSDHAAACRRHRCRAGRGSCCCGRCCCRAACAWPLRPRLRRACRRRCRRGRRSGRRRWRLALLAAACRRLWPELRLRGGLPLACCWGCAGHAVQILLIQDALALLVASRCAGQRQLARHEHGTGCHGAGMACCDSGTPCARHGVMARHEARMAWPLMAWHGMA